MKRSFLLIIIGATLWGTIGWYVKHLYALGFTPMEVVTLRAWTSALLLFVYQSTVASSQLKLQAMSDLKYFIGTGVLSIIFFNFCLFMAMELSTIPIATALLYTAPAFVAVFSYFLFKEPFTKIKFIALVITLIGTSLVVGLLPFNQEMIPMISILFGIGSAIGYAMYSIFSKFALEKYSSLTITTYTFLVAAITLTPFFPYEEKIHLLLQPKALFYAFGLGLLPTAVAYILYTNGLKQTEASYASILATIEPVVATCVGIFLFHEPFSFIQMLGMACIIGAVILIQVQAPPSKPLKS